MNEKSVDLPSKCKLRVFPGIFVFPTFLRSLFFHIFFCFLFCFGESGTKWKVWHLHWNLGIFNSTLYSSRIFPYLYLYTRKRVYVSTGEIALEHTIHLIVGEILFRQHEHNLSLHCAFVCALLTHFLPSPKFLIHTKTTFAYFEPYNAKPFTRIKKVCVCARAREK